MERRVTYHVKAVSPAAGTMVCDCAADPQNCGYFCQGENALWAYGKVGVFDPVEHGGFADYTPWMVSFEYNPIKQAGGLFAFPLFLFIRPLSAFL